MSLLGAPTLAILAAVSVAAPIGAALVWRRVRGPRMLRVAQRFGLVLLAQLSAVLLFLVGVNDYGDLFTSWSQAYDALTASTSVRTLTVQSAADGSLRHFGAADGFVPGQTSAVGRQGAGRVISLQVHDASTGLSSLVRVYLPAAYLSGARRLPMVLVFSGYPGSGLVLTNALKYPAFLTSDIADGLARPMVLVMMSPSPLLPRDTECTNIPHGPQVLSYLGRDVPNIVSAQLHLQPTSFGAIGHSTGGYCALKLAMMQPGRFRAGAALSGYFEAPVDATTGDLYGGSLRVQNENNLLWRVRHGLVPHVSLFAATSRTERGPDGFATQQLLAHAVKPPLSLDEFILRHGYGHSPASWNREIPSALSWLSWHLYPRQASSPTALNHATGSFRPA